jgi:TPR repeat protein
MLTRIVLIRNILKLALPAVLSIAPAANAGDGDFGRAYRADQAGRCDEAVPAYEALVLEDAPGAMVNLGRMYMSGRCVERDPAKAEQLFVLAATYADPNAHANLGALYFEGLLGQPDYARAYMHWSQAARRGVIFFTQLAKMHYEGLGVPKDPESAEAILLQGAARDDQASIDMLVEIYADPAGPLYAPEKAAKYARR